MPEYDNTGILGRNEKAFTDRHPSHKGSATIDGVEYWISAWVRERKDGGGRFFSLKFEIKDGQKTGRPPERCETGPTSRDDEIHF